MRAFLLLRLVLRTHRSQFSDYQEVEDQYKHQWNSEAQNKRIKRKRGLAAVIVRPVDVTADDTLRRFYGVRVKEHGNHKENTSGPGGERDYFRDKRRAYLRGGYRMAHGYVAIGAHDEQKDATGELIDARGGHVHFAHNFAEYPTAQTDGRHQKRYSHQKALVRDRQIYDVHVRNRLHLRETQNNVDDQSVAEKSDHANDGVEDLIDQRDNRQIGVAVRAVVRQIVVSDVLSVIHEIHCRHIHHYFAESKSIARKRDQVDSSILSIARIFIQWIKSSSLQ